MTAPTPTEQATLDRIEAAPDAEESLRERVARAMFAVIYSDEGDVSWDEAWIFTRRRYLRMADAAIAVMRGASS